MEYAERLCASMANWIVAVPEKCASPLPSYMMPRSETLRTDGPLFRLAMSFVLDCPVLSRGAHFATW